MKVLALYPDAFVSYVRPAQALFQELRTLVVVAIRQAGQANLQNLECPRSGDCSLVGCLLAIPA